MYVLKIRALYLTYRLSDNSSQLSSHHWTTRTWEIMNQCSHLPAGLGLSLSICVYVCVFSGLFMHDLTAKMCTSRYEDPSVKSVTHVFVFGTNKNCQSTSEIHNETCCHHLHSFLRLPSLLESFSAPSEAAPFFGRTRNAHPSGRGRGWRRLVKIENDWETVQMSEQGEENCSTCTQMSRTASINRDGMSLQTIIQVL